MSFSKKIEIDALEDFAERENCFLLTEAMKNQARNLLIASYTRQMDNLGNSLAEIRSNKYLNNK